MKKVLSLTLALIMLLTAFPVYVSAAETNDPLISSVTYTLNGEQVIETIHNFENGVIKTTIVRTISPSGNMNILVNGTQQATLGDADYELYFSLVGSVLTFRESDLNRISQNSITRTTNFGCGHNDKIHSFVGQTTQTYYASDMTAWTTVATIASKLAKSFNSPYEQLFECAAAIFAGIGNGAPDKMVVTESIYDVLTVGDNTYLFTCHHFLVGEYTWTYNDYQQQFAYMLSDSYDYFTQSIGG